MVTISGLETALFPHITSIPQFVEISITNIDLLLQNTEMSMHALLIFNFLMKIMVTQTSYVNLTDLPLDSNIF